MATIEEVTVRELTDQQGLALLDAAAQRYLSMTGERFIEAWFGGAFDEDPDRPEVMRVAMLLPFGR